MNQCPGAVRHHHVALRLRACRPEKGKHPEPGNLRLTLLPNLVHGYGHRQAVIGKPIIHCHLEGYIFGTLRALHVNGIILFRVAAFLKGGVHPLHAYLGIHGILIEIVNTVPEGKAPLHAPGIPLPQFIQNQGLKPFLADLGGNDARGIGRVLQSVNIADTLLQSLRLKLPVLDTHVVIVHGRPVSGAVVIDYIQCGIQEALIHPCRHRVPVPVFRIGPGNMSRGFLVYGNLRGLLIRIQLQLIVLRRQYHARHIRRAVLQRPELPSLLHFIGSQVLLIPIIIEIPHDDKDDCRCRPNQHRRRTDSDYPAFLFLFHRNSLLHFLSFHLPAFPP